MAPYISVVSSAAPTMDAESPHRAAGASGSKSSTPCSTPTAKRRSHTLWTPPSPQSPQARQTARTNSLTRSVTPPGTPRTSERHVRAPRHPWTPPSRPSVHRLSFDAKLLSSPINQTFLVKKPAQGLTVGDHISFAEQFLPPGYARNRHMREALSKTRCDNANAREQPFAGLSGGQDVAIEAMRYRRGRCNAAPGSIKHPGWTARQCPRPWAPEKALEPWPAPYEPFEPSFGSHVGSTVSKDAGGSEASDFFFPWPSNRSDGIKTPISDGIKTPESMGTSWA